ncbi:MAG: hypothetical protein H0T89_17100 [Deltaproteobacteria bacterium]|nr:hypothetical protein [Deltaproteobacteria bacterium]MDQ3294977.1 hypothetical protein [Myxococcota bacterium]
MLRATVDDVVVCCSTGALPLIGEPIDIVVASYDAIAAEHRRAFFDRFDDLRVQGRLVVYLSEFDRPELAILFGERQLMNILARSDALDADELSVTLQKMLRGEIFGVDRYFRAGATTKTLAIHGTSQRDEVFEVARRFATDAGVSSRHTELFCTVVDELVTNALYNAPRDNHGRALYAHFPRTQEVTLQPDEQIDVTMCVDGQRLGIAVADPYGSLTSGTVLQYLAKCFRKGTDQLDQKDGGAGLGLYQVFESVTQFVVNLDLGKQTEIIGLIDFRGRYRDFVVRPKSINIFDHSNQHT